MSNDNKTLADVQPGGMVRLATVPYDRARDLMGDAYNAGTHGIGYSQQAMELHDAIIPVRRSPATCKDGLQVQSSPGGQDALLESLVARWRKDADLIGASNNTLCQKVANCTMRHAAELQAALVARQPVASNQVVEDIEQLAVDIQPVEQTTDTEIDARLNALYREMVDSGQHNGGMSGVAWDRAVYRMASNSPAQAVDQGLQQDAARWRAIAPHLSVEWDEDEMLKRWTWIDFKGDALSFPTRTRESYASVDEAMDAMIDSRAVGNG